MSDTEPTQEARREGGQPGNTSALKTGTRTERHGLVLTRLGGANRPIQGYLGKLRKGLESHVLKQHGSLSAAVASQINLACRYEATALICQKRVADNPDLPNDVLLSFLKATCWASQHRHSLITKLGLDGADPTTDPWASLDAPQTPQGGRQSDPTPLDDPNVPVAPDALQTEPDERTDQ